MLSLKGNQGTLHEEVKLLMDEAIEHDFKHMRDDPCETIDGDHGRIEKRRLWCTDQIDWFWDKGLWPGLRSFACVESERTIGDRTTREQQTALLHHQPRRDPRPSFRPRRPQPLGIENSVHGVLDVAFNEDRRRVRKGHGAENFSMLRRIALNMLRHEATNKVGIKTKRLRAGGDEQYLLKVLATHPFKCDGPVLHPPTAAAAAARRSPR